MPSAGFGPVHLDPNFGPAETVYILMQKSYRMFAYRYEAGTLAGWVSSRM
jgi:hypothetical protein